VDNSPPDDLGFTEHDRFTWMYQEAMRIRGLSQLAIARANGLEQGQLSKYLNGIAKWPPDQLKEWLFPLNLSRSDYALMYRRGLEEFAPPYVQELIGHFVAAYKNIIAGNSIPPINDVLAGRVPRRRPSTE
jgi:transcriptional regulator with XRE-family HTH domain